MSDTKPIVKGEERKPCGCIITTYVVDGKDQNEISPCTPCGLMATARNLQQSSDALFAASQALQATATRLHKDRIRANLDAAVKLVVP